MPIVQLQRILYLAIVFTKTKLKLSLFYKQTLKINAQTRNKRTEYVISLTSSKDDTELLLESNIHEIHMDENHSFANTLNVCFV